MSASFPLMCGVALRDITPAVGLMMTGFAARQSPATGAHDALTARALVVNDTALVILDVLGLTQDSCRRIVEGAGLSPERVIVQATHTHGGPATMPGRLWSVPDADYLAQLEAQAAAALRAAWEARVPARLTLAVGQNARIGRNRRHQDGVTDPHLSLVRVEAETGETLAMLANYACHPVVLAADNLLWTADFPHFLREALEAATPGALALFATGFTGDVNTGHSAQASISREANPARSFARAAEIGAALAQDLLAAPAQPLGAEIYAGMARLPCHYAPRPAEQDLAKLSAAWQAEYPTADPIRQSLLQIWQDWAKAHPAPRQGHIDLPVWVLNWGGALLIGLPGEIFAQTALDLRAALAPAPVLPLGFSGDNPGYIPAAAEYAFGGYEVDEAHRFYNLPASFVAGTAEALGQTALALARACLPPCDPAQAARATP